MIQVAAAECLPLARAWIEATRSFTHHHNFRLLHGREFEAVFGLASSRVIVTAWNTVRESSELLGALLDSSPLFGIPQSANLVRDEQNYRFSSLHQVWVQAEISQTYDCLLSTALTVLHKGRLSLSVNPHAAGVVENVSTLERLLSLCLKHDHPTIRELPSSWLGNVTRDFMQNSGS